MKSNILNRYLGISRARSSNHNEAAFLRWVKTPHGTAVYCKFEAEANRRKGPCSADHVMHTVRRRSPKNRINNSYVAYAARLYVALNPNRAHIFQFRNPAYV